MVAYVLDAMRVKEGAFLAVWLSLILTNMSIGYNTLVVDNDYSIPLALLALLMSSAVLLLTGAWATVQFKWIQIQYPAVVIAFERVLLTSCLPTCGTVMYWGLVEYSGMETAPFFVAGLLCAMYAFFGRPLQSSFYISSHRISTGGGPVHAGSIQKPIDGFFLFLTVVSMPGLVYLAAHYAVIFEWKHIWSIVMVISGPLLFLSSIPGGMWWMGSGDVTSVVRRILALASFATLLAGIEGRIVFHSFGQYIRLAAPWSYIAISLALYGAGSLVLLHVSGMMGQEVASALVGPVLMVSSSIGSLVVGVPLWALPAPLVGASGIALFYESRSMRDYLLVVVGGLSTCGWFLWQHFWFLDIDMDGMRLKTICWLIFIAAIPAILVPGLVMSKLPGSGALLLLQSIVLAILEEHLYSGDHLEVTFDIHPMFPASMIVGTSILGIILAKQMCESKVISKAMAFALQCIYGAKLVMITVPEARLVVPVSALALASLHPLFLGPKDGKQVNGKNLLPWQGLAFGFFVLLAVAGSRFAVFDTLHLLLHRRPSEALAAGSLLLLASVGLMPLVNTYYGSEKGLKRFVILMASLGILLALLRPPLPIKGGAECPKLPLALCPRLWDASHTPEHEEDDVAVYGDGLRRREHWPLWLIVSASFFGILAATSKVSVNARFAPIRLLQASISGALVGAYMALEFFPGMQLVQTIIILSALLVAFMVVLLSVPSRGSAILLPILGLAWICTFPASLAVHAFSSLPPLPQDMKRLHPEIAEGIMLDRVRRESMQALLIACFAAESLILSFACKLRLSSYGQKSKSMGSTSMLGAAADAIYIDKAAQILGDFVPSTVSSIGGHGKRKYDQLKSVGLTRLPEIGNFLAFLCYCLSLWINWSINENHAGLMSLILSSVLLLLTGDSFFCKGLSERRRYFPPYAAGASALAFTAIWEILADTVSFEDGFDLFFDGPYVFTNTVIIVLTFPSLLAMSDYLWNHHHTNVTIAALTGMLASGGVFMSDVEPVRVLAGLSGVTALFLGTDKQLKSLLNSTL